MNTLSFPERQARQGAAGRAPFTGQGGIAAQLAPSIKAFAGQLDQHNDLPGPLIAQLREMGAFALLTPWELGGTETTLRTALEVYEEIGRLDASVAWVTWNANFGFIGALLGEAGIRRIWREGEPEPIFANSGTPGSATPTEGGYWLCGRWRIVGGINFADWLVAVAVVGEAADSRLTDAGQREVRLFAVPVGQARVSKVRNTSGLCDTGGQDVLVDDIFVPGELTARLGAPARIDRPLYRGFLSSLFVLGGSAIVLGVAATAIDEMVRSAGTNRTLTGSKMADVSRVQSAIATSEADLQAARLLLFSAAEALQAANEGRTMVTAGQRTVLHTVMNHSTSAGHKILVDMHELAGSMTIAQATAPERQFRDGMAALQHYDSARLAVWFDGAADFAPGGDGHACN